MQASVSHVQPLPAEVTEMTHRAGQVVRLLEELRRMTHPEVDRLKIDTSVGGLNSAEDHRPPKRPWEDLSRDGGGGESGAPPDVRPAHSPDL